MSPACLLALSLLASTSGSTSHSAAPDVEPARVLVLGVYHFANPGLDVVKTEVADVLTDEKQEEIFAVIDGLARFEPDHVAVEADPSSSLQLAARYDAYVSGAALTRNETEQLGFRLAELRGLPGVDPIDHAGVFPYAELMDYAREKDPGFVAWEEEHVARSVAEGQRRHREDTVGELLRAMNDPASLAESHAAYLRMCRVGAGDGHAGADLLARWYERNVHIFANLQRLAEPGASVLVIIGAGHAPILRELIAADPALVLVDPLEYLPSA